MNIKQIRLSKNMTQKQLADAIGVDHTIISKYEKGQTVPSVSRLEMIAKALGVNVDMILNDEAIEAMPATTRRRAKVVSIDDDKHYISESSLAKKLIDYYKGTCELCGKEAPLRVLMVNRSSKRITLNGFQKGEPLLLIILWCYAQIVIERFMNYMTLKIYRSCRKLQDGMA